MQSMQMCVHLTRGFPKASATPARVTSSLVGPTPPAVMTISYASDAARTSALMDAVSSETITTCVYIKFDAWLQVRLKCDHHDVGTKDTPACMVDVQLTHGNKNTRDVE